MPSSRTTWRGTRAGAVAARLRREHAAPAEAPALGDAFWLGADVALSEPELDRVFGPGFAARVRALPPRQWSEPIPSAYGTHVVRIDEREPGRLPALAEVRARARRGLEAERAARRLEVRMAALRAAYGVAEPLGSGTDR